MWGDAHTDELDKLRLLLLMKFTPTWARPSSFLVGVQVEDQSGSSARLDSCPVFAVGVVVWFALRTTNCRFTSAGVGREGKDCVESPICSPNPTHGCVPFLPVFAVVGIAPEYITDDSSNKIIRFYMHLQKLSTLQDGLYEKEDYK